MGYTYLLADLKSGDIMEELPLTSVTFGQKLNGSAGFSASAPMQTGHITPGQLVHGFSWDKMQRANIKPGARLIHVLRDGKPMYSGLLNKAVANPMARTMTLSGSDHLSYLARRRLDTTQTFTAADQFQIVRDLVDEMQKNTYGDLGIQVTAGSSGVTRTRTFEGAERWRFGDAVHDLATKNDGFEYAMRVAGSVAAGIVPTLTLGNQLGVTNANWVLQLGKNVETMVYTESAEGMANTYTVLGNGNGDERPLFTANNPGSLNTYPQFDEVRNSESNDTETENIRGEAYGYLAAFQTPVQTAEIQIKADDPDIKFGAVNVGDSVRLIASYGWLEFDQMYRIMSMGVNIDENGRENVIATLTRNS
jgi:hypothetical protein